MRYQYQGNCSCGVTRFVLHLPQPIDEYNPRACDCSYCTARGVRYLSDPMGTLTLAPQRSLKREQQGSNQAVFLLCPGCDALVAVTHYFSSGLKGGLNVSLLKDDHALRDVVSVSPKLLSAGEKRERWEKLWMAVEMSGCG